MELELFHELQDFIKLYDFPEFELKTEFLYKPFFSQHPTV